MTKAPAAVVIIALGIDDNLTTTAMWDAPIAAFSPHSGSLIPGVRVLDRGSPLETGWPERSAFGSLRALHTSVLDVLRHGVCAVARSQSGANELIAAVRLAVAGYLPVKPDLAVQLARGAADVETSEQIGAHWLTKREREVFRQLVQGMSNAEIADSLAVANSTVKSHVQEILRKLGLRNRLEAVLYAHQYINISEV